MIRQSLCRWVTACALFVVVSPSASAQTSGQQKDPIAVLQELVPIICGNFEVGGSNKTFSFNGEAKAKLASLFRQLADAGVSGAGTFNVEEYTGVLRNEIAPQLSDVRQCRLKIWNDLNNKLFPDKKSMLGPEDHVRKLQIGVTSVDYLISKLGEPTSRTENLARFDAGGSTFFVYFEDQGGGAFKARNVIQGIAFVSSDEGDTQSVVDGRWNRNAWCKDGDISDECHPIVSPNGFGKKSLSEYIVTPNDCEPALFNHIGDNDSFVRITCGAASQIAIYVALWPQNLQEFNLELSQIYNLHKLLSPTLGPDPQYKFAPPRMRGLDEVDKNRRDFIKYIGKLRPSRIEVGIYKADYADIDQGYESFHRAQDFGRVAD